MSPTPVQAEVLGIIGEWFNTYRKSPSLRDIAKQRKRGGQVRSVVQVLGYLEAKGFIRRRGRKGIEVLPLGQAFLSSELSENPYL